MNLTGIYTIYRPLSRALCVWSGGNIPGSYIDVILAFVSAVKSLMFISGCVHSNADEPENFVYVLLEPKFGKVMQIHVQGLNPL